MIFDTHIHIDNFSTPEPDRLRASMDAHGVDRLALFSDEPAYLEQDAGKRAEHNAARLDRLIKWCAGGGKRLLPIYFINPVEPDALEQVDRALDAGAIGFKVICETYYPGDPRAMPVYQHIADLNKAILFHSGILWDYGDNGKYNRPCFWECMFDVRGVRFALAHISWPWCDEAIAVYGKFCAMSESPKYSGQQMYIDMTPGTPPCYRKDVIKRLHDVGYWGMGERLLFGTDSFTNGYTAKDAADLFASDTNLLLDAGFTQNDVNGIMGENALRFWGIR